MDKLLHEQNTKRHHEQSPGWMAIVFACAIAYWRVSKIAFCWLIPDLTWNVFTTFIKIWRLLLNVN